jgi:hypothetical protein
MCNKTSDWLPYVLRIFNVAPNSESIARHCFIPYGISIAGKKKNIMWWEDRRISWRNAGLSLWMSRNNSAANWRAGNLSTISSGDFFISSPSPARLSI